MNDTVCSSWDARLWCAERTNSVGMGEAAARCMSLGSSCGGWIAHRSRNCGYMTPDDKQSVKCKQAACKHCERVLADHDMAETHSLECGYKVAKHCENSNELLAKHLPEHKHHFAEQCTYTTDENDRVVIPMKDTPAEAQWTRTTDGLDGLEWRANDSRIWPSVTGRGEYCYHVKFARQGTYFVTAQTRAQGIKQHNDMYMRFSGELEFYHADIMRPFPYFIRARNSYFKVYQNVGVNQLTKVLSTIDGIPHILVTKHVKSTRKYHVCISGRSSKFAVYRIFFIRCHKMQCKRTTEFIQDALANNTATPCLMD